MAHEVRTTPLPQAAVADRDDAGRSRPHGPRRRGARGPVGLPDLDALRDGADPRARGARRRRRPRHPGAAGRPDGPARRRPAGWPRSGPGSAAGPGSWTASSCSRSSTRVVFRVLVAALTISLIACTIHRFPGVVAHGHQAARSTSAPTFFEHAPQHEAVVVRHTPAETLGIVAVGPRQAPLPDAHAGRRLDPPLRGPLPLGAVRRAHRPPVPRRDPRRRHRRLHVRLSRHELHDRRGRHPPGRRRRRA